MSKFVLRCKSAPDYFLLCQNGKQFVFTNDIEEAHDFITCLAENANAYFAVNYSQLCHQLFEVYEVPEPKYAIRVVGTKLYIESIFNYVQFVEDLRYVLVKSTEAEIKEVLGRIAGKIKSKLEIVKL